MQTKKWNKRKGTWVQVLFCASIFSHYLKKRTQLSLWSTAALMESQFTFSPHIYTVATNQQVVLPFQRSKRIFSSPVWIYCLFCTSVDSAHVVIGCCFETHDIHYSACGFGSSRNAPWHTRQDFHVKTRSLFTISPSEAFLSGSDRKWIPLNSPNTPGASVKTSFVNIRQSDLCWIRSERSDQKNNRFTRFILRWRAATCSDTSSKETQRHRHSSYTPSSLKSSALITVNQKIY